MILLQMLPHTYLFPNRRKYTERGLCVSCRRSLCLQLQGSTRGQRPMSTFETRTVNSFLSVSCFEMKTGVFLFQSHALRQECEFLSISSFVTRMRIETRTIIARNCENEIFGLCVLFLLRNQNESLIFRHENMNIFSNLVFRDENENSFLLVLISCFETRTRNRK